MVFIRLSALFVCAYMFITASVTALAHESDDPEIELTPEFKSEVLDDTGDFPVEFTIGFGTHSNMPDGASAKLVLSADSGCEIEGMDDNAQRIYGYSSVANEKYVCQKSSNGGYYPNYGETVRLHPGGEKCTFKASLTISDKDNSVIHSEDTNVYILSRDDVIVLSDTGFDDCEQKLDKPFYKFMLFLKTPLGTVIKIVAFIFFVLLGFGILERKRIRMFFRRRKALKREKLSGKGGNENG